MLKESNKQVGLPKPHKSYFGKKPGVYSLRQNEARRFALMYVDPEKIVFLKFYGPKQLSFVTDPHNAMLYSRSEALLLSNKIWHNYDLDMKVTDINNWI